MPKISELPAITTANNNDTIAIVETSTATTKKITRGDLLKAPLPANSVTTAAIANSNVTTAKLANASVTADKIDFATLGLASANGVSNYVNNGEYKFILDGVVIQRGGITVDKVAREIVIGSGISVVYVSGTVMAESATSYLFLKVRKNGVDVAQSLTPASTYIGSTIAAMIPVSSGDRISLSVDTTATIRGKFSNLTVMSVG